MFATLQSDFAMALLDPDKPVPEGVIAHTGRAPAKRFAVYRNNVVVGLVNALRDRFPAVEKIVGGEFFSFASRIFVRQHPPRSPLMMEYGEEFPDFLAAFEPAAELPYLPDVARLESFRIRAYHAADADPLDASALQQIDPDALQGAVLTLHPSLRLLRSRYPVVTIWAMNSGKAELAPVEFDVAEDALVLRQSQTVTVQKLSPGGAAFVSALLRESTLADAAEIAFAGNEQFNLASNLATLIAAGAITGIAAVPTLKEIKP